MKLLLDTQAFLWITQDSPQLTASAKKFFLDSKNACYLSLASSWEMAIKISIQKLRLKQGLHTFIPQQLQVNHIQELPITFRHVVRVAKLPFYHRDPFDRLLVSQALEEDMSILSIDAVFDSYGVKRIW